MQFRTTTAVGSNTLPLVVHWGPGGQVYRVWERVNGNDWETIATGKFVSITRRVANGNEYRYRVRAQEGDDWTDDATSPEVQLVRASEASASMSYRGKWKTAKGSKYIGGKAKYATKRGAKASFTFEGRSVAVVGPKGPTRGKARVYIDGRYVKTINMYSRSYRARQVVFAYNWSRTGDHRVSLVVLGTKRHPMVAIDAMYVLD